MTESINQQMQEMKGDAEGMLAGRAGWDRSEYGNGMVDGDNSVFASDTNGARWNSWHSQGTYLENEPRITFERVCELAPAFASEYEKLPALVGLPDGSTIEVPGWRGVTRMSDHTMLGYVTAGYPLIGPAEAFAWVDDMLNDDSAKAISAVMLREGRQMTLTVELPGHIKVAGWDDETIRKLLVLTNSFDAKGKLAVACSPVRGECINSTRLIFAKSPRVWSARHTSGIRSRMDEARHTLQLSSSYFAEVETTANAMVEAKMPRGEFDKFMQRLVPLTPYMADHMDSRMVKNRDRAIEAITNAYTTSDNLANVRGTRWGALQAVLEWNQWARPVRETKRNGTVVSAADEKRFRRALVDDQGIETRAMKLLVG
jgi:phage/plasmid-like protein (TIGR03299 family)